MILVEGESGLNDYKGGAMLNRQGKAIKEKGKKTLDLGHKIARISRTKNPQEKGEKEEKI